MLTAESLSLFGQQLKLSLETQDGVCVCQNSRICQISGDLSASKFLECIDQGL